MKIFAPLDKVKSVIESIRGLNLAAVMCTTIQVSRLPLWLYLHLVGHNLLYRACTDKGLVYILYITICVQHEKYK
jgi:hypothetical protein